MTENEALEKHKEDCKKCWDKACEHNIQCLQKKDIEVYEELSEYRAIGTVEELKTAMKYVSLAKKHGTVGKTIDSCAEYESIGTIKEFKALKEKSEPKKVVPRHIRKYDGFDDGECPTCGNSVLRDGFSNDVYCDDCGQKLDWSE